MIPTQQLSLPKMYAAAYKTRHGVGFLGEGICMAELQKSGYSVSKAGRHKGDVRAVHPETGEIILVEVKTSKKGKDGRWRFTLFSKTNTASCDHNHSDVVILIAITKSGQPVFFSIPVEDIPHCHSICIPSNPRDYAGKYARYRVKGQLTV